MSSDDQSPTSDPTEDQSASIDPTEEQAPSIDPIAVLLEKLTSTTAEERRSAIEESAAIEASNIALVSKLEQMSLKDRSKNVRAAALEALTATPHQLVQRSRTVLPYHTRRTLVHLIQSWLKEEILNSDQAALLSNRFNFDLRADGRAAKAKPSAPRQPRSLSDILLSPGTIRTALYLGAFFILAAAFIFAGLLEPLRVFILFVTTAGFLVTALALKKKLADASFILFIIFSLLVPIDWSVLADAINLSRKATSPYWLVAAIFLALCWGGATWFYKSRFFSVLSALALSWAALLLGDWIEQSGIITLVLLMVALFSGLGLVAFLDEWQDKEFARPLFITLHLQLLFVQFLVFVMSVGSDRAAWEWVLSALVWLLASGFYVVSNHLHPAAFFPYLATAALLPSVWMLATAFDPSDRTMSIITWLWGAILAFGSEALHLPKNEKIKQYSWPALIASIIPFSIAPMINVPGFDWWDFGFLLTAGIIYAALTFYRPRQFVWLAAMLGFVMAYLSIYLVPPLEDRNVFPGFMFLWPAIVLLIADWLINKFSKAEFHWHTWPRLLGILLVGFSVMAAAGAGFDRPLHAIINFVILSALAVLLANGHNLPWLTYAATGGIAAALLYTLIQVDKDTWLAPYMLLVLAYYLAGLSLELLGRDKQWTQPLIISGLGLGVLVAFSAPAQGGPASIISTALVATLFAVEAYRRRQVWLALPANLLYLGAYFMALIELNIDQPQFYSIGAALLGMIMHYLLVRSDSKVGALIIGMLSQLILLSTTYLQMASTGEAIYFFILFFQALAVLAYGLVFRSRSLVITPIVFIVIGVLTVMFSELHPVFSLFILCGTGFLFLALGIYALFARERLLEARQKLTERMEDWQA